MQPPEQIVPSRRHTCRFDMEEMRMKRRSASGLTSILLAILLAAIWPVSDLTAQDVGNNPPTLEQLLNDLAQKGLPGPLVATLETPPPHPGEQRPSGDASSLEGIAESFGLKLFKQDGIYVIGAAERHEFADLFSSRIQQARPVAEWCSELVQSLTASQFRALGSRTGLPFHGLTQDQQAIMAAIFSSENVLAYVEPGIKPDLSKAIPAESMPFRRCSIAAWLEVTRVKIGVADERQRDGMSVRSSININPPSAEIAGWRLAHHASGQPPDRRTILPIPPVANTLKDSQLDYSLAALRAPVSASGRTNLRDLIAQVAKATGLDLRASPGAEHVPLFVSASNVPAGSLLKAVSLATTGTWRRFGSAYVFTADVAGIGQITARLDELHALRDADRFRVELGVLRLIQDAQPFSALSFPPDSPFVLYPEQISRMLAASNAPASLDRHWIPWGSLGPGQQAFLEARASESQDKTAGEGLGGDPAMRLVQPTVRINLTFHFPDLGPVMPPESLYRLTLLPPDELEELNLLWSNAPVSLKLPLNTSLRGYVCKPSKREGPADLISALDKHGFNTLYVRVFTDGYAAFPSAQFPMLDGLDGDYLRQLVSLAHSKGIKVFAVVDVLRWSDGRKGHWLAKNPELLDYDIFGQTHAQWASTRAVPDMQFAIEEFILGEGLTGDAVTPLSPVVRAKLEALLGELASYSVDGLVLDHTSMSHPSGSVGPCNDYMRGSPGHSGIARQQFFLKYGVDSVDIPARLMGLERVWVPLQPIIAACSQLRPGWEHLYEQGCDSLIDALVNKWTALRKDSPIWVMDMRRIEGPSRDWSKFRGRVEGLLLTSVNFRLEATRATGLKAVPVVQAPERMGTLIFASLLAQGQSQKFEGMFPEVIAAQAWNAERIIIDFTSAGRQKSECLRLITPPQKDAP